LVWDLASLPAVGVARHGATAAHAAQLARFVADADQAGLRSGVTFGLVNPRGPDHCVVSFGASHPSRAWIADIVVGQAYATGLGVHEFLSRQAWPPAPRAQGPGLSAVQHQVLSSLTRGLSDREIAWQLDMSSHNVDYHVRQLKKKYSVQSRVQLAYLAGRLMIE
jgi:DNA-binding CsgD family transcriptional regulator